MSGGDGHVHPGGLVLGPDGEDGIRISLWPGEEVYDRNGRLLFTAPSQQAADPKPPVPLPWPGAGD